MNKQKHTKIHTKSHTYVAKSTIPNAGNGLFSKHAFKSGHLIVEFKGGLFKKESMLYKLNLPYNKSMISFPDGHILYCDEDDDASYANDCIDFGNTVRDLSAILKSDVPFYKRHKNVVHNASIKLFTKNGKHRAFLQALVDIPANSEICCHYGFPAWLIQDIQEGRLISTRQINDLNVQIATSNAFKNYICEFYTVCEYVVELNTKTGECYITIKTSLANDECIEVVIPPVQMMGVRVPMS